MPEKSFPLRRRTGTRRDDGEPAVLRLELTSRGAIVLVLTLATLWLALRLWPLLILVIISLMLAAALMPFVEWLMDRGRTRTQAVGVVGLALALVVVLIGLLVVPSTINQGRMLAEDLPEMKRDIATLLRERDQFELAAEVERFEFSDLIQGEQVVNYSRRVLTIIISTLTVIFLTIYLLIDARRIERFLYFCIPDRYVEHVQNLLPALRTTVGGYVRGQLLTSGIIALYTFVVLFVLDVPNAIALGAIAGIADVVPLIGAFIAIVPAVLVALTVSPTTAAIALGLLLLYQQFEDRILVPRVYGSTLRLPTIAVFLAVLAGATLAGIVGAVLALPGAAAIRVFIIYFSNVRQGRVEPAAPEDELFAPDDLDESPARSE